MTLDRQRKAAPSLSFRPRGKRERSHSTSEYIVSDTKCAADTLGQAHEDSGTFLAKEGLIRVGDKRFGEEPDRYFIEEVLPAGLSFIAAACAARPTK